MSRALLWSTLASVAVAAAIGVAIHWFVGVFLAYVVIWAAVVEATVGFRRFVFFDGKASPAAMKPSIRWVWWLALSVAGGLAVGYAGIRAPDPLSFAVLLLVVNTLYTAWAVPWVGRRLRDVG